MSLYAQPINAEDRNLHQGATHRVLLKHTDLTETATNTAQSFTLLNLPAHAAIRVVKVQLAKAFKDASDAAFNTTTIKLGDGSDDDRLLPAIELNENGTEVVQNYPGAPAAATYAAPDATPAAITGGESPTETEHNNLRSTVDSIRTQVVALAADVASLRARATANVGYVYTSATDILLAVGSMSAKALNDIDNGEVHIFLNISDVTAPL